VNGPTGLTVPVDRPLAMADTEHVTEVPNPLVRSLLDAANSIDMSLRSLARQTQISAGTIAGWKHGANPGARTLARAGLAIGLRLEALPNRADYPGLSDPPQINAPNCQDWWGPADLIFALPSHESAWYLCGLIGAEVHWNRAVVNRLSRAHCSGSGRTKTWMLVEQGMNGRGAQASIKQTSQLAGEFLLGIGWVDVRKSWRVRPWDVAGAPARPPRIRLQETWPRVDRG
jgi:hypothetical protein